MRTSSLNVNTRPSTLFVMVVAAVLGGCATPPNPADMRPTPQVAKRHAQTVSVAATSLVETPETANSTTSSKAISDAIAAAVDQTKLFSQVVKRGDAQYQLSAVLIANETPLFGASFTATCEMGWTLSKADGATVWREVLKSEGTATAGEAFAGVARARMARERAIRENITRALTKVGQLDF